MSLPNTNCACGHRNRRPFTLVELLVGMVIIMILAGLFIRGAGVVSRKNADAKCQSQIHILEVALEQYRQEFGYYPMSYNNVDGSGGPMAVTNWFLAGRAVGTVRYHGFEKPNAAVTTDPGIYSVDPADFTYFLPKSTASSPPPPPALPPDPTMSPYPCVGPYSFAGTSNVFTDPFPFCSPTSGYDWKMLQRPYYYQSPGIMNPQSFDLWTAGVDGKWGDPLSPPALTVNPQNSQKSDTATQNCDDITNWKRN